jgi:Zn-dependent protease with chaperone function
MTFSRVLLTWLLLAVLLSGIAGRASAAQTSAALPAPPPSTAEPSPATPAQAYTLPPDKLAKAVALDRLRNILDIVSGVWGVVFLWLLLATGAAARMEALVKRISSKPWQQGLQFFALLLIAMTLASLPIGAIGHYASVANGISVQGWGSWFVDLTKSLGLAVGIGSPILLLFNWIVRRWPSRYWFAAWLVALPIMVIGAFVSPLFEPIFYQYEPLSKNHASLVEKLETVVARTGTNIPPDRMFLMKASLKTNGLNAYVDGLGPTKRIVVWDNTAGRIPDDEVQFIFGHESGHYVLNHIPKGLAVSAVGLLFIFWACAGFAAWLARRLGANWGLETSDGGSPLASRAGFVVLIFAITLAGFLLEPVDNAVSRYFEHQADVYGQEAMHGLVPDPRKTAVASFQALGEAWLEDPNPNPIIEFWLYNHPSVKNRANFAAQYNPWANGGHGEFFAR